MAKAGAWRINLSHNQLSGQIPANFASLRKLKRLNLSHNDLSGQIDVLGDLEELNTLDLSFNQFSGEIPAFRNRIDLYVGRNQWSGCISAELKERLKSGENDISTLGLPDCPPP